GLATILLLYLTTGTSLAITRQIPERGALHVAGKLGVVYLPAAIIGLVVAAVGRSEGQSRRAPAVVAAFVAAAASLQLFLAVRPGGGGGVVRSLTPDGVVPLTRAAGAFTGLALLFAARGLARRHRRAWQGAGPG